MQPTDNRIDVKDNSPTQKNVGKGKFMFNIDVAFPQIRLSDRTRAKILQASAIVTRSGVAQEYTSLVKLRLLDRFKHMKRNQQLRQGERVTLQSFPCCTSEFANFWVSSQAAMR